jgi:stalled ribosome rescue protein Dom34
MKREVGVWIDHRKAVIAIIAGTNVELRQVTSGMEARVRYSGAAQEDSAEDQRDRRFTGHLNKYYAEVIACIRGADSILILGPGEAKIELEERLGKESLSGHIVGIETVDKMTDRQIAARVRQRFLKGRRKRRTRAPVSPGHEGGRSSRSPSTG